jgi:sugar O-acyltransferase (sialic acid O-acetyltransferase NeuD family)
MTKIIIIGSGAVAAELTTYIEDQNNYLKYEKQLIIQGYIDFEENIKKYWAKYNFSKPVLNDIVSYNVKKEDRFIIGISDIEFRMKMIQILKSKQAEIIGFIHKSAIISNSAKIGIGNIIYPHCIVGPNSTIGDFNIFTSYSFVSHDCIIGNENFFATAGLSGHISIGDKNYFGIRSTVLPNISVGDRNIIQAGMIVDKSVKDNCTVFHRFKEKVIAVRESEKNES